MAAQRITSAKSDDWAEFSKGATMTEGAGARREPGTARPSGKGGRGASAELVNPMDRFVGYKIRRVQHAIINELNGILGPFELRVMDFAVLNIVDANPGMIQNGITRLLGAEPPAVVLSLHRLEGGKYLTRQASADDRRLRTLQLTASGKKLLKAVNAKVEQQEHRIKRTIGADLAGLVRALDDLMDTYGLR
jgi:DNA-binding MarR family transcriptional regulator